MKKENDRHKKKVEIFERRTSSENDDLKTKLWAKDQ